MHVLDLFRLDQKLAVVTGGAQGLGKAMAEAMADCGADIAVLDLNMDKAAETAKYIENKYNVKARAFQVNVADADACYEVVEEICKEWGHIDVLLNNAGICINEAAENVPLENWHKVIDINMNGVWYMSQAVGKIMIKQNHGNIINISSMSGFIVNDPQGQVSYNTSKAGVSHMTKSLAAEWVKYGIRVNSIAPGYMDTDLVHKTYEEDGGWARRWNSLTPMKRPGKPEELGPLVVYLASDASTYMTGSIILCDGGYTIW
ncbi:MAG: SDR family oxidoreductase [Ruminococcus sp.]|jgi:NAD(P)-dependent dehydrogenase (short-subunit alcohol dehydrogenase family)|nr:SDR family oxidoreductase [Ruminococcus sp.]